MPVIGLGLGLNPIWIIIENIPRAPSFRRLVGRDADASDAGYVITTAPYLPVIGVDLKMQVAREIQVIV